MMKLALVVLCGLLVVRNVDSSKKDLLLNRLVKLLNEELKKEEVAREAVEMPNRLTYMADNCPKEVALLASADFTDGISTADILGVLKSADVKTWGTDLFNKITNQKVEDADQAPDYFKKVMCNLAFWDGVIVRLALAGEEDVCYSSEDTNDAESLAKCIGENVDYLEQGLQDFAGVSDLDDAVEDFTRIVLTISRIRVAVRDANLLKKSRSLSSLLRALQGLEDKRGKPSKGTTLDQWITTQCGGDVAQDELKAASATEPVTLADMKASVKSANVEAWMGDVRSGLKDVAAVTGDSLKAEYKKIACSMAPILKTVTQILAAGIAGDGVCKGKGADLTDINVLAGCVTDALKDLSALQTRLSAMDDSSDSEDAAVLLVQAITLVARIAEGIWLGMQIAGS